MSAGADLIAEAEAWAFARLSPDGQEIVGRLVSALRDADKDRERLDWLPPHQGEAALTHNGHRSCYESVADYAAGFNGDGDDDWVSPAEREKAIAADEVWELRWYPDTPVGFCRLLASSLSALRAAIVAARTTDAASPQARP